MSANKVDTLNLLVPEDSIADCEICGSERHTTNEHYKDILCNREMTRR
jgi:hypothetical protein